MNRLWSQVIAAAVLSLIYGLLPPSIAFVPLYRGLFGFAIALLLGSGVLAALVNVSAWPDRGAVVGTLWAVAGVMVSNRIFGAGVWTPSVAPNAAPGLSIGGAPVYIPQVSLGASLWSILVDLAVLCVGMAIVAAPVAVIVFIVQSGRARAKT